MASLIQCGSLEFVDGDDLILEGTKRWQLESFFKKSKRQFGLNCAEHERTGPMVTPRLHYLDAHPIGRTTGQRLASSARRALLALQPKLYFNRPLHLLTKDVKFLDQDSYLFLIRGANSEW